VIVVCLILVASRVVEYGVVVRSTLRVSCEDVGFRANIQVLSHWRNKYTSSPITCKMDVPSKTINAVPDQQPFTVLVTGANRQVVSLPHDSNDG
jgi:hypothetical protein